MNVNILSIRIQISERLKEIDELHKDLARLGNELSTSLAYQLKESNVLKRFKWIQSGESTLRGTGGLIDEVIDIIGCPVDKKSTHYPFGLCALILSDDQRATIGSPCRDENTIILRGDVGFIMDYFSISINPVVIENEIREYEKKIEGLRKNLVMSNES